METIKNIINPNAKEYIMAVNRFLILWAVKLFKISIFMLLFSKNNNPYVNTISNTLYKLIVSKHSPKSIPNKIIKNTFNIQPKLKDNNERGRI